MRSRPVVAAFISVLVCANTACYGGDDKQSDHKWADAILCLRGDFWLSLSCAAAARDQFSSMPGMAIPDDRVLIFSWKGERDRPQIKQVVEHVGPADKKEQATFNKTSVLKYNWGTTVFITDPKTGEILGAGLPMKLWRTGPLQAAEKSQYPFAKPEQKE